MKNLGQTFQAVDAFSAEVAQGIITYIEGLHPAYWFHRHKINSKPTKGITAADYFFLGNGQQPKAFKEYLKAIAPTIDNFKPVEMCINRYEVGNGMPEHIDIAQYSYNMVIPLSDHGDGLLVNGDFYVDVPGKGLILPMRSPPHEVPPVNHRRYTLIYLYD